MGWVFERVREIVVNVRGLTRHRARVRSVCIAVCVPKALGEGDYGTSLKGPLSPFQPYKLVKVELDGTRRPLTASELNALEKTHPDVCEWTTPLSQGKRKWQKTCAGILKKLFTMKRQAWPFVEPVDWEALNIPDYPVIIKHPMDLKTNESKLHDGHIESPDEFVALVRTVVASLSGSVSEPGASFPMAGSCVEMLDPIGL